MARHWFGNLPDCGEVAAYRETLHLLDEEHRLVVRLRELRMRLDDLEQKLRHRAWLDFSSVEIDQAKTAHTLQLAAQITKDRAQEEEEKVF